MNLFTITFAILLVLKLLGKIALSWWLVTSPLWGGFLIVFFLGSFVALMKELAKR